MLCPYIGYSRSVWREIFLRRLALINRLQFVSRVETRIIETRIDTYLPGLWVANSGGRVSGLCVSRIDRGDTP
jgi:hypothetical protein